ncbi:MAG: SPOR domain-containing protein [bacterium]
MRDSDRLKEKLEVSLDNRQLFYLFFGSAVVACLVFVVGVLVGKKLEDRKQQHKRPAADELALIDADSRIGAKGLTFHDELIKPDARSQKNLPPEVLEWRDMGQGKANVVALAGPPPAPGGDRLAPAPAPAPGRAGDKPGAQVAPKKQYTLQVSAFQDRGEADQVIKKLQKEGYRPYMVASKLPKRGVWYRVRLGAFGSWNKALEAKKKFEEKINMTAYVSRR